MGFLDRSETRHSRTISEGVHDCIYSILEGDCNKTISIVLGDLQRRDLHWSPTFCFIDPDALDVEWSTLTAISRFKDPKAKTKPEMLILLSHTTIPRLAGWDSAMVLKDKLSSAVTGFFGTEAWKHIFEERSNHGLSADEARHLYTELFRYRIQTVLGYNRTLTIEMGNERGSPIYVLVFATDHDAGVRIMLSVFNKAREQSAEYRTQVTTKRKNTERETAGEYSLPGLEHDTLTGQPRYFESVQTDEFPNIPAWLMKHL